MIGTQGFRLSDLPSTAEFLALFDQYRLTGVDLTFSCDVDTPTLATAVYSNKYVLPMFARCIDYTDGALITTPAQMRQEQGFAESRVNSTPISMHVKPQASISVYSAAGARYGSALPMQWVDTIYDDVDYYGTKYLWYWGTVDAAGAQMAEVTIDATYHLEFRGAK
jgi:hypothetical protein